MATPELQKEAAVIRGNLNREFNVFKMQKEIAADNAGHDREMAAREAGAARAKAAPELTR